MSDPTTELNSALEGRYRIERKLGEGGMATVYLADDRKHERKVALKVLNPELAAVVGADRFLAEIKTTANLQHPHILPLYDSGEAAGFLYYVMPYVTGESLRERLDRERQLPVADAAQIATNVAEALDYAHRQGVIHRDIKPENVLLGDGKPVVADFGIALAVGAAGRARLTETGLSLGTPHYMSPEQATGDQTIGPPTDIYALGCVLYEMLVGEPPYTGSTPQAIFGRIIAGEASSLREQRPTTPVNVDAAVRRALEPLPADRFPRAGDFARALADPSFRHGREGSPGAVSHPGLWKRLAVLTATSTLLLAVGLGWLLSRHDPPDPVIRVSVKAPGNQVYDGGLDLSPDGSFLVYSGVDPEGERSGLWLRRWSSLDATPITGRSLLPAISPDGQEIVYCSEGEVRVVSVHGGEPRTLARRGSLAGSTWSDDGAWVYFADLFAGLKRVPAQGGPIEPLTVVDTAAGERGHADPRPLPGDRGLLFSLTTTHGVEIAALDLETREVKRLGPGTSQRYSPTGHLLFIDEDGTLFAAPFDVGRLEMTGVAEPVVEGMAMANPLRGWYAVSETGTLVYLAGGMSDHFAPVWVARDGTAVEMDPEWRTTGRVRGVALSPTADRLAISMQDPDGVYDLWVKRLDRGPLTRITFEGSVNRRPTWSPEGRSLRFISNRAGQHDLWVKRADGSGSAEVLLDREGSVLGALYSRDGTWLIFEEIRGDTGISGIFAIRPSVDSLPIPLVVRPGANAHAPALSPDGRWLAYVSDESGQDEVYVRPFPDAESGQWQISSGGGTGPVWAHSGRELFYRNGADDLVAVQVSPGSSFASDRQEVLFPAADYFARNQHPMYDVSPDDRRFVMLRSTEDGPWELIRVENFFQELGRLVPVGDGR